MSELRHLPGASYRGSNAFVVAQRRFLNLKDPFPIDFERRGAGNRLHDWYTTLENPYIHTMQLRKERESPFFHEFIVIRLKADTYWRIDRRQLADENTPINSFYTEGVPARDTIEQVPSLDSPLPARSYCLVELEFNVDVHLALLLRVCRAIQNHKDAKVYTLPRYNCYFFAQTLIFCTACGISDWAGVGELKPGQRDGPWKSPNTPVDFSKPEAMENSGRLTNFKWRPNRTFTYEWSQLSALADPLIKSSSLLIHANRCDVCLESQLDHRQRSLSKRIDRLKQELVEYWNAIYREVLDQAYLQNHKRLVNSGVWGVVSKNVANDDCKEVVLKNLDNLRIEWKIYSRRKIEELVIIIEDLLNPDEVCDHWWPDPDEWKSTWTHTEVGPVGAEKAHWQKETTSFLELEISQLEKALEMQTIEAGHEAQRAAMLARIHSFAECMNIRTRVPQHEGDLIISEGAAPANDRQSVLSGKTKRSKRTVKTMKTMLTMRAVEFKDKMRRFFGKSHKMEEADITKMKNLIEELVELHAGRVEQYKLLLHCEAIVVQRDIRDGVDDVWNHVIS